MRKKIAFIFFEPEVDHMITTNAEQMNSFDKLGHILLSTLDEAIFFTELAKFVSQKFKTSDIIVYKTTNKNSLQVISEGLVGVQKDIRIDSSSRVALHVLKNKRAYFSNNIKSDPLFSDENNKHNSELCAPISIDGVLISVIRIRQSDESFKFSQALLNELMELLVQLNKPLRNMKLYMEAMDLNETLLRRIEENEIEIQKRNQGMFLASQYQTSEKEIIGKSKTLKDVLDIADKVATSELNLIITGEAGTGKKLVAKRIHCRSNRKHGSFIAVDCGAKNANDFELELFGAETTNSKNIGVLEAANNGTLVLNNIGAMNVQLQSKLLKFIEDGVGFRVGSLSTFRSNVRILATTTNDIEGLISKGMFREDLFYAINKVSIAMPPLRERLDDIDYLVNKFLNDGKGLDNIKSFTPGAIKCLKEHTWPGNIRELQNVVERADVLSNGTIIDKNQLPDELVGNAEEQLDVNSEASQSSSVSMSFENLTLQELEQQYICMTLDQMSGNKTKTAKTLGITVKTLYNKLHSYGMIQGREA